MRATSKAWNGCATSNPTLRATHKVTGVVVERRGTETVSFDADGLITSIEVENAT